MTHILLYWNHICVLHKQEKAFLEKLTLELRDEDIDLEIRYFGLGYPEHMSEYLARPDARLPDLILSADLEVFEDSRIFKKISSDLYPVSDWIPMRQGLLLDTVQRSPYLLPVAAIPLVYYTREPEVCAHTDLVGLKKLAFGGINNSAAKTIVKTVWERHGVKAASTLLECNLITDMPIGAFQAVRQQQAQTALIPSLYSLRADNQDTFLCVPKEGPVLIPSYLCARTSIPEWAARRATEGILSQELCDFYVKGGDLIIYPARTELHSSQETDYACCPSAAWLEKLNPIDFYGLYCSKLPTAKDEAGK